MRCLLMAFILFWVNIIIKLIVKAKYFLSDRVDCIRWPAFRVVHDILEILIKFLKTPKRQEEVYDLEATRRGNAYIDELLIELFEDLKATKYYYFKDEHTKLGWKYFHGEFDLYNFMAILKPYFIRSNNCTLREENGRVKVKARIYVGALHIGGLIRMKFLKYEKDLNSYISVHRIQMYTEFDFDKETLKDGKIEELQIENVGEISVWLVGRGFFSKVLNFIANYLKSFDCLIKTIFGIMVKKNLTKRVSQIKFVQSKIPPNQKRSHFDLQGEKSHTLDNSQSEEDRVKRRKLQSSPSDQEGMKLQTPESCHSDQEGMTTQTSDGSHSDQEGMKSRTPKSSLSNQGGAKSRTPESCHSDQEGAKSRTPESCHSDQEGAKSRTPESSHSDQEDIKPRCP